MLEIRHTFSISNAKVNFIKYKTLVTFIFKLNASYFYGSHIIYFLFTHVKLSWYH